jgi:predicted ABC-type transport system involved in lysophospholipase L1 biosynthesis ATPase subunit
MSQPTSPTLRDLTPGADRDPVIAAEDLRVWYGTDRGPVKAVDGVSFELQPGEILGLVGESGCGKSTLGRGLLGLLPDGAARDGALRFRGEDLLALKRRDQYKMRGSQLGMIFQEPLTRLNPLMRIADHFSETLKTHEPGISKAEVEQRSLEALRVMGIPPTRFRAYPHEFSAAAPDDRPRPGAATGVRRGRRAHDGPRRAGRGADHPDPPRPPRDLRHLAAADHPQPRHHRRGL